MELICNNQMNQYSIHLRRAYEYGVLVRLSFRFGGNGGGGGGATVVRYAKFAFLEARKHNTSVLYVKYTPNINIFEEKQNHLLNLFTIERCWPGCYIKMLALLCLISVYATNVICVLIFLISLRNIFWPCFLEFPSL